MSLSHSESFIALIPEIIFVINPVSSEQLFQVQLSIQIINKINDFLWLKIG